MFPAFRVKGIWPNARRPAGTHPVTGVPLSKFELTDTILQLPLNAYDDIVERYPESRLKYFDEDKDEVTIGSKLELAAKLNETTTASHVPLLSLYVDPKTYTSAPDFLPGFHLDDTDAARKPWPFFVSSTILRNQPARDLWTGAVRVPANDLKHLLNDHAFEFMTGYGSTDPESSSNAIPQAWERIQELYSQAETSPSLDINKPLDNASASLTNIKSPLTSDQSSNVDPENANIQLGVGMKDISTVKESIPTTDGIDNLEEKEHLESTDRLSLAHEAITKDMASLHQELDEHLEKVQVLTKVLDQKLHSNSRTAALQFMKELDAHLEIADAKVKVLENQTAESNPSSLLQSSSVLETNIDLAGVDGLDSPHKSPQVFPEHWNRHHTSGNSTKNSKPIQKEQHQPSTKQSPAFPDARAHLTDLGMKDSREAGMKLRNQLHAASTMITALREGQKTQQQVLNSFDPPAATMSTDQGESAVTSPTSSESTASAGRKKSVRFSIPPFVSEEYLSDGDFWSPGAQDFEPQTFLSDDEITSDLEGLKRAVLQLQKDVQKQQAKQVLSDQDAIKVQQLVKAFDEYDGSYISRLPWSYKDNLAAAGLLPKSNKIPESSTKPTPITGPAPRISEATGKARPEANVTPSSVAVTASKTPEISVDAKQDSVETTVTKLWCQAVEGIMSNVDTFAEQLDVHVKSQIAREQDTLTATLSENRPPQSLENDQAFLADARHSKDLITVQENVQGMINVLRFWHKACKNLLAPSELCSEQEIDTARVKKMNEQLRVMALSMVGHFEALYYTFVPATDNTSSTGSDAAKSTRRTPRRYAAKTDSSDSKIKSAKQNTPHRSVSSSSERRNVPATKRENPFKHLALKEHSTQSPTVISVDDLKHKNLAFKLPIPSEYPSNFEPDTSITASQTQHPSRRFSWSSTDEASVYRWQQSGFALDQHRPPKPTDFIKDSSEVLLPSFPPLVPRRESRREKRVSHQKSMPDLNSRQPIDHSHASGYYTWLDDTATGRPSQRDSTAGPSRHSWHFGSNASRPHVSPYFLHQPQPFVETLSGDMSSPWELQSGMGNIFIPSYDTTNSTQPRVPAEDEMSSKSRAKDTKRQRHTVPHPASSPVGPLSQEHEVMPISNDDVFHIFQDIPEHRDPKTANKILDCVEGLKDMGYGSTNDGGDARLVVYAQAAKGNLMTALDIIEEERKAYREQGESSASFF